MKSNMASRLAALEASITNSNPLASFTDAELDHRILRLHLEREPSPDELDDWMSVPSDEAERRNHEMLLDARRQLRRFAG